MKTRTYLRQIFAAMLCMIMMLSILPVSANAAKENFSTCSRIGIRDCEAPVAGQKPDFNVTPYSPGQYTIMSINWYKGTTPSVQTIMGSTMSFEGNTVYTVEFEVWAKDAYTFTTDANGNTTVTADVGSGAGAGEWSATVWNVSGQDNKKYLTVRCTFPATEKKNSNDITSVALTGLDLPVHHLGADTSVTSSDYRVTTEVVWTNQDGSAFSGVFEYGKSYTVKIYLFVNNSFDFAKDYTHPFATSDRPMPAVTVTLDGETLSVLPDYTRNPQMRCLVATKVYKCEGKLAINSVRISDVAAPVAGGPVNYNFTCANSGFEHLESMNDSVYHKGVAWRVAGGNYLETSKGTFDAGETYQIVIRLVPKEGFEFDADGNGNTRMTATVNGNSAEVKSSKTEAIVTYTFPKTGNVVINKVDVAGLDAPAEGQTPDYTATYAGAHYGAADYSNATTKNGISWYNETDKKTMSTSDKFEAGKTYTVQVMVWANDGHEFQNKSGTVNVSATVNGANAEVSSRNNEEVTLYYTFPKIAEHKHSPLKVEEVKASCKEAGKKSYYFCPECGKNFEDSKCTKEIANILSWGVTEKLEHTGGKATCDNRAICKNCGEYYGEFAEHQFGTAWDYKDASGHAHKCKVCGIQDTVIPHSGGTATCGELAKCAECKAEYGEVMQHQWSKTPEYTDAKGHAFKCTVCGEHDTVQAHTGGTADCKNKAKCSVCGTEYGKTGEHKWTTQWDYTDAKGHAHKCTVCGDHDSIVKHTPGAAATETSSQNCTVCNYVIEPAKKHEHKLTKVAAVDADCTTAGKEQHYVCDGCGKIFSDSKGSKEITDKDSLVISAAGHKDSKWKSDADVHWKECTVKGCGAITVEKEAHEFNKAGKCTVCGYKSGDKTDSGATTDVPQTTDKPNEQDTTVPGTPDVTDDPGENTTATPDTGDVSTPGSDNGNNTAMLIAVIASGAIALACIIVVVVVIAKKKNEKAAR